ncbi:hypothetical protein [Paraburkholderia aromaticivorans]|uniref:hypothetical protein n=1 Tax=Paraburkholderia aromaticivorans TaxID=2026199 RepID=UPI001FC98471|nr:hypothetical protein [Paraburkholderia aromaticivorans]
MTKPDFISDSAIFYPLWERANGRVQELASASPGELLYFDSIDISTQKFFELVRALLAFEGAEDFVTMVLKPDPFSYFNFHFISTPASCIVQTSPMTIFLNLGKKIPATVRQIVYGPILSVMRFCRRLGRGLCTRTENGNWAC